MADFPHAHKSIVSLLNDEANKTKTWVHPINQQHYIFDTPSFNEYDKTTVPIEDLIRDNDLNNPIALNNHPEIWSPTGSEDDIHPDQFVYDPSKNTSKNDVIYGTRKLDGRIVLSNGRHRIKALGNGGYTHAIIPVYDELINSDDVLKKDYHSGDENALKAVIRGYRYIPNYDLKTQKRIRDQFKIKLALLRELRKKQGLR